MPDVSSTSLDSQFQTIAANLAEGRVIPFLGAGANLCDRPPASYPTPDDWNPGRYLPSGAELACYLRKRYGFPQQTDDLIRISQYVSIVNGTGPLYEDLHRIFNADYLPTPLHRFIARIPSLLRSKGYNRQYPLIVTTNYDDLVERALRDAEESFDVVTYIAEGGDRGKFRHELPDGTTKQIDKPNKYMSVSLDTRPVVLKLHGAVHRGSPSPDSDSYVITEDDYIDYLGRTDVSKLVPVKLREKLLRSNFLFLGYKLADWNLRAILHRIWAERSLSYASWGILRSADAIERSFWSRRGVELIDMDLGDFIAEIERRVTGLTARTILP